MVDGRKTADAATVVDGERPSTAWSFHLSILARIDTLKTPRTLTEAQDRVLANHRRLLSSFIRINKEGREPTETARRGGAKRKEEGKSPPTAQDGGGHEWR